MNREYNQQEILHRLRYFLQEEGYEINTEIPVESNRVDIIFSKQDNKYIMEYMPRIYSSNQLFSLIHRLKRILYDINGKEAFIATFVNIGPNFQKMIKKSGVGYIFIGPDSVEIIISPGIEESLSESISNFNKIKSIIKDKVGAEEYNEEIKPLVNSVRDDFTYSLMFDSKVKKEERPEDRQILSDKLLERIRIMPDFPYKKELELFDIEQVSENKFLYDIVINILKKLWLKHKKGEVRKVFDNFKEFEPILFKKDFYRDHFFHQFHVFMLGGPIIEMYHNRIVNFYKTKINSHYRKNDVYFSWLLASTFHDIGYPIQEVPYWINRFFTDYVNFEDIPFSFDLNEIILKEDRNFLEYIDKLCSLFNCFLEDSTEKWYYNKPIQLDKEFRKMILEQFLKNINHGIISSLCLLDMIENGKYAKSKPDYLSDDFTLCVLPAALAIMLHDPKIFTNNKTTNIYFDKDPLSFLLIYCDTVQDWGRPSRIESGKKETYEPKLTDLIINKNKVHTELTYKYKKNLDSYSRKCKEIDTVFNKIKSPEVEFSIKLKYLGGPEKSYQVTTFQD